MKLFPMLTAASVVGVAVGLVLPATRTFQTPVSAGSLAADQDAKASARADDEDEEEAAYQAVLAKRAIEENCLICHEAGMYTNQRLTPAQWKAEVEKMVSWGTPLAPADQPSVIAYLANSYRDVDPDAPQKRTTLAEVVSLEIPQAEAEARSEAGDPAAGAGLYKTNCANCHGPTALGDAQGLGPSLAGRAVMNSRAAYDEVVHKGLRKMPAFDKVLTPSQQHDVFAWLLQISRDHAKP
jgi:mono/diheme cytochrome c family protein